MSIMGLFQGKFVLTTNKHRDNFMLAYGYDRHFFKIILIDLITQKQYIKFSDSLDDAEEEASKCAVFLYEYPLKITAQKLNFQET